MDLVTLPKRDTVQLTIYNSEDLTLALETREITLRKGNNRLQFSWAGTLIDPSSVEFRPLQHADKIELADTVFPGQKPQHLIWNIESEVEGPVLVEVSYFTSGLTWRMDYVSVCDAEEESMDLRGHVRVFNNSGEAYENAEIRLIVGKINLVEKIAALATRLGIPTPKTESPKYNTLRRETAKQAMDLAGKLGDAKDGKSVVKEGLSEYFMFRIEGSETIPNGWSKRMRAVEANDLRFDIVYRMRDFQYGPRPVRFFVWRNDQEHKLGESPLPNGVVRVFRSNQDDGLSYLGQQLLRYVPIRAKIEVNLGTDDLVVFEHQKQGTRRDNFQFDRLDRVTGWDERSNLEAIIRNYRGKPIQFELRLRMGGDVEIASAEPATAFDYQTVEAKLSVEARGKSVFPYERVQHHGANAKQNRVRLKPRS